MEAFIDWLIEIPVQCKIGIVYAIAILLLPIGQWIDYRIMIKKYGKEEADEIARRW